MNFALDFSNNVIKQNQNTMYMHFVCVDPVQMQQTVKMLNLIRGHVVELSAIIILIIIIINKNMKNR